MVAMRAPESRVVVMSVVLVGIGSMAGDFLDRLSFPHVAQLFTTCASSKQFMTEFRIDERRPYGSPIPGLSGEPLNVFEATVEVDGQRIGELERYGSLRHFFCEGNHRVRIHYSGPREEKLEHAIDVAVSRPSLFHVTASRIYQNETSTTCVSEVPCWENVALELSPWEPDDLKVR